jgi:hypothetical protein
MLSQLKLKNYAGIRQSLVFVVFALRAKYAKWKGNAVTKGEMMQSAWPKIKLLHMLRLTPVIDGYIQDVLDSLEPMVLRSLKRVCHENWWQLFASRCVCVCVCECGS